MMSISDFIWRVKSSYHLTVENHQHSYFLMKLPACGGRLGQGQLVAKSCSIFQIESLSVFFQVSNQTGNLAKRPIITSLFQSPSPTDLTPSLTECRTSSIPHSHWKVESPCPLYLEAIDCYHHLHDHEHVLTSVTVRVLPTKPFLVLH
jgi:hypothetical protein